RFSRDWSSDVCSSDLITVERHAATPRAVDERPAGKGGNAPGADRDRRGCAPIPAGTMEDHRMAEQPAIFIVDDEPSVLAAVAREIGRASCRGRGEVWG